MQILSHKAALYRHKRICAVGRLSIKSEALHICATCMKPFSRRDNFVRHSTSCLRKKVNEAKKKEEKKANDDKKKVKEERPQLDIKAMCAPLLSMLVIIIVSYIFQR